jgi:hypothetical protein
MQGERNRLERCSVQREEAGNRWGTKGYKYPKIQNSNGYITEVGTSEKISELPTIENSADCSPYDRNLREKLRNLRTTNSRGKTAAGHFPWGEE